MPKTKKKTTKAKKQNISEDLSSDYAEAQLPVDWAKQCYDWLEKSRFTGPIQQTSYKMVKMHLQQSLSDAQGHQALETCIKQYSGFLDLMYQRQSEDDTWEKFKEIIYQRYKQGNLMDADNILDLLKGLAK